MVYLACLTLAFILTSIVSLSLPHFHFHCLTFTVSRSLSTIFCCRQTWFCIWSTSPVSLSLSLYHFHKYCAAGKPSSVYGLPRLSHFGCARPYSSLFDGKAMTMTMTMKVMATMMSMTMTMMAMAMMTQLMIMSDR